jgi:hypothetical protein
LDLRFHVEQSYETLCGSVTVTQFPNLKPRSVSRGASSLKDAMALRSAIAPSVWPHHNIQNHLNYENLGFSQIVTRVTARSQLALPASE